MKTVGQIKISDSEVLPDLGNDFDVNRLRSDAVSDERVTSYREARRAWARLLRPAG
ncbi:hypothetical protein [Microbacterium sp. GXF7504]